MDSMVERTKAYRLGCLLDEMERYAGEDADERWTFSTQLKILQDVVRELICIELGSPNPVEARTAALKDHD